MRQGKRASAEQDQSRPEKERIGVTSSPLTSMALPNGSSRNGPTPAQSNPAQVMTPDAQISESPELVSGSLESRGDVHATSAMPPGTANGAQEQASDEDDSDEEEEGDDDDAETMQAPPISMPVSTPQPAEEEMHGEATDEEDDDESDNEDDEEPALKYGRLGGFVHDLLKKDSASAMTVANKHMVRSYWLSSHELCSDKLFSRL